MAERVTNKDKLVDEEKTEGQGSLILSIWRDGDKLVVDLIDRGANIPRGETLVKPQFFTDLCAEMERSVAWSAYSQARNAPGLSQVQPEVSALLAELQGVGRLLFSQLLTRPVRDRLKHVTPCDLYLRLDSQLLQIPWELCFDGEQFLATKFCLGRQIITDSRGDRAQPPARRPGEKLRILMIADPTETLPNASAEVEQLCSLLDSSAEVTLVGGKNLRKLPLLSRLERTDVVHFAGHSVFDADNPRESGWLFHDDIVTASELSKLDSPPLLVFSNSCQAGTTAGGQEPQRYEGDAFGLGSAFLQAGVPNFIGTFWPVHDAESLGFAVAFYRSLTAGHTLGRALLQARHETMQTHGADSLTWASYMLYGDPAFRLLPGPPALVSLPQTTKEDQPPAIPVATARDNNGQGACRPRVQMQLALSLSRLSLLAGIALIAALLCGYWWFSTPASSFLMQQHQAAFAALKAGQVDVARSAFHSLATHPQNSLGLGYDGLAAIDFESGDLAAAEEALQKSLTANPANVMALLIQGDLAFTLGEKDQALKAYLQAIKAETAEEWQHTVADNALGVFYTLTGALTEARDSFNAALRADENDVFAHSNLGYLLWQQGKVQDAQRALAHAQKLQPTDELSRTLLVLLSSPQSNDANATGKILLFPFVLEGGNLRRLGEGEALAWQLSRQLHGQAVVIESDAPGRQDYDPATVLQRVRAQGAAYGVWGGLQSYATKLIIHGSIAEAKTGTVERLSYVQKGGEGRLDQAAQVLAEQVSGAMREGH